jgi:D-alanyl-D-alanine-carboxypeptidase/D-alanyl-D-alanine-endopeptidase
MKATEERCFSGIYMIKIDKIPGENILYSNAGMILLGVILENIYNTTYSELVNSYFVLPLNMKNTETVYFTSGTDNYTGGYDRNGHIMPHITFQIAGAGGGIKSCTADLVKYIRANINSGDEAMKLSHNMTIRKNEQKIGLGWQINSDFCGAELFWHDGGEPGFSGYIALIPEYDIGIICLANQRGRQGQLENLGKSILKDIIKN